MARRYRCRMPPLPRPLRGIIPPLITPLLGPDELDCSGLEQLIEHVLSGGVNGLFILGTSGEGPSLGYGLRRELVTRVCAQVAGRVPVLVGITDTAAAELLRMARHAADAGADAVVASTPYYFPVAQPELAGYFERLVPSLPLPLFLYNMPMMTKVSFGLETLQRLADLERIVGIKDSSGDLDYFRSLTGLRERRPDWPLLMGPEHLLMDGLRLGGHGGVAGGANVHPRLFSELYGAVSAGENRRAVELQADLLKLGRIYGVGRYGSAVIQGMKCAASLLGLCRDTMAEPFEPLDGAQREQVRAVLAELGLLPA